MTVSKCIFWCCCCCFSWTLQQKERKFIIYTNLQSRLNGNTLCTCGLIPLAIKSQVHCNIKLAQSSMWLHSFFFFFLLHFFLSWVLFLLFFCCLTYAVHMHLMNLVCMKNKELRDYWWRCQGFCKKESFCGKNFEHFSLEIFITVDDRQLNTAISFHSISNLFEFALKCW